MNKNKLILFASQAVVCGALIVGAIPINNSLSEVGGTNDLVLTLDKNDAPTITSPKGEFKVKTEINHNDLVFDYDNCKTYSEGLISINGGGFLRNPYIKDSKWHNAISGIKSISINYGGFLSSNLRYGYEAEVSDGSYFENTCKVTSNGFTKVFEGKLPTYFCLDFNFDAMYEINIDSIQIVYTCFPDNIDNYSKGCLLELNEDQKSYAITRFIGNKHDVTLPSEFNGLPVTSIAPRAFENNLDIEILNIPDTITSIGETAFYSCKNLLFVKLSSNLTSIPSSCFHSCEKLKEIYIPTSIKTISGANAFYFCGDLENILYQGSEEQFNAIDLGYSNKLKVSNATRITCNASQNTYKLMSNANYDYVLINNKDIHIKKYLNDKVTNIDITKDFQGYNVVSFSKDSFAFVSKLETFASFGDARYIPEGMFSGNEMMSEINIPDTILNIGPRAFHECAKLAYLKFPSNLQEIEDYIFSAMESLSMIYIPKSVTTLGSMSVNPSVSALTDVFYEGTKEEFELIPNHKVLNINNVKFTYNVSNTMSFDIKSNGVIKYVENSVNNDISLYECVSNTVKDMDFKTLIPGKTITSVAYMAFFYTPQVENIVINPECLTLSDFSLSKIHRLKHIELPEGLKVLNSGLLNKASDLTSIVVPSTVIIIKGYAFDRCLSLTEVRIPNGVTTLYSNVFTHMNSLTDVYIPSSVTTIKGDLFGSDTKAVTVHCQAAEAGANWDTNWLGTDNKVIFNESF